MGVTFYGNNTSSTDVDMGYGYLGKIRMFIASTLDKNFGECYKEIYSSMNKTKKEREDLNKRLDKAIDNAKLEENYSDTLDFLFACDCDGKVSHKACKQIYDLTKDFPDNNETIYDFRNLLMECYTTRKKLRWF